MPIASDGWRFILPFGILGVFLLRFGLWWSNLLGGLGIAMAVACALFFRDFNRPTPADDSAIYSPGDGHVLEAGTVSDGEYAGWKIVRIFLSVLDGHVQRSPVAGKVTSVVHKKGSFLDARHVQAHLENEQNAVKIASGRGTVVVKQIAGLIARRIVCWVKEGTTLAQGERYGLIRFGSQVDVLLPASTDITVKIGEKVLGGLTVLARWR